MRFEPAASWSKCYDYVFVFKGFNYQLMKYLTKFKVANFLRKTNVERKTPQSVVVKEKNAYFCGCRTYLINRLKTERRIDDV